MAAYYITCVTKDGGTIQTVGLAHDHRGWGLRHVEKAHVVDLINSGHSVYAVGPFGPGLAGYPLVHVVRRGLTQFLQTDPNDLIPDNLGNLPSC